MADLDGKNQRQLTSCGMIETLAQLDSQRVVVVREMDLWLYNLTDLAIEPIQMTKSGDIVQIGSSPDQKTIFFTRASLNVGKSQHRLSWGLAKINRDGSNNSLSPSQGQV